MKKGGGDAGTAKYSSNNIMSLSYAAHINGDKVYDIATGYWIEAKQEAAASAGRMQWAVYLYDNTGTFVEKYSGVNFSEEKKDDYLFAGFDINITDTTARYRVFYQALPSYEVRIGSSYHSPTLKQYFSGEQGYAINADYAVIDVQPLAVSDNGTYTAPFSKAYSPVTVDVQEQPWQPLEDGYSNFWFELTDDTLSLWLNFWTKTENAVIDWGDGSGEVALDTLTPTHTYAKAGKYVVKVKGVTRIAAQHSIANLQGAYVQVLKAIEHNSEVIGVYTAAYRCCVGLEHVVLGSSCTSIGQSSFDGCVALKSIALASGIEAIPANMLVNAYSLLSVTLPNDVTTIGASAFSSSWSLTEITITSTIESIGNSAFASCRSLETVHCQATTPPTLGTNTFKDLPANWLCYVPVGYGETYKSATRWSDYADHILEEGQTPNRAMLSRLAKETDTDTDTDTEEMR